MGSHHFAADTHWQRSGTTTTSGVRADARRPGARRRGGALMAVGAVLLVAAAAWAGCSALWARHVQRVGQRLVADAPRDEGVGASGAFACAARPTAAGAGSGSATTGGAAFAAHGDNPVRAVLQVPAIHLVAPVEQGDSDAVLAVAVGHLPASVWPGTPGTSVLAAHDVSYFVHVDQLRPGDLIDLVTPCTVFRFSVTGGQVVRSGSPVYDSPGPTLVLETCWPTDALWYTPDRYLVTASLVAIMPTTPSVDAAGARAASTAVQAATPPTVRLPTSLVATGLTLATNDVPMGTMTISGTAPASWAQSPAPLAVESAALELFIGALKAAEQGNRAWWQAAAPDLAMPSDLDGASVVDWHQGLDVHITTAGTTATAVVLTAAVSVAGGAAPGLYDLTVNEPVVGGTLTVGSWDLGLAP